MSVESVYTLWTDKGLKSINEDNWLNQMKKNLAYIFETTMQVSGTDANGDRIDRNYSNRTSNNKKMVFLSFPLQNPLFPIIVIEELDFDANPVGHNHEGTLNVHMDIQVKFVDKTPENCDKLRQNAMKFIKNSRNTLKDYGMSFQPANFLIGGEPARPDPDLEGVYFNTAIFRFFSFVQ